MSYPEVRFPLANTAQLVQFFSVPAVMWMNMSFEA